MEFLLSELNPSNCAALLSLVGAHLPLDTVPDEVYETCACAAQAVRPEGVPGQAAAQKGGIPEWGSLFNMGLCQGSYARVRQSIRRVANKQEERRGWLTLAPLDPALGGFQALSSPRQAVRLWQRRAAKREGGLVPVPPSKGAAQSVGC